MIRGMEAILLSSEDGQKLADFYKEKVGLKLGQEMEMGDKGEKGFEFELSGVNLYIMDHSKVKGKSHDPSRIMFNLEVDDIGKEAKRLKDNQVKVIENIYHIEGYGLVATFEDIDGNYFQFVQIRAS